VVALLGRPLLGLLRDDPERVAHAVEAAVREGLERGVVPARAHGRARELAAAEAELERLRLAREEALEPRDALLEGLAPQRRVRELRGVDLVEVRAVLIR